MAVYNPLLFLDINGQGHIEPSVSSKWAFDEGTQQRFVAQHDVVLLSHFEGGLPNVLVPFVDLHALQQTYDPQNLHILGSDLASFLKTPSFDLNVRGAYLIYVLRLGRPTQAQLTLQDLGATNVLALLANDYGTYTNSLSVQVGTGSVVGKMLTFRFNQTTIPLDNLQNSFHLAYTGNGSAAALTVTRTANGTTRLQTSLTGATDGSIPLDLDLTQDTFATVQQLVTYLNGSNGYRASIDVYGDPLLPSAELDSVSGATIRTPVALSIHYVGAGSSCALTVTNTTLSTTVSGGPGGETLAVDLTTAPTNTLGVLVAALDALPAYSCTLGPNADRDATCLALLAPVVNQDIRTATYALAAQAGKMDYVHPAVLGSLVQAIQSRVPWLTASRVGAATTAPANLPQTFLAGGTNPTPTVEDWLHGLDVVANEALAGALLFPVTTDPVIQDATEAWVLEQRQDKGASFRAFFALPAGTSTTDALAAALGQNSTFTSTVFQGGLGSDGVRVFPPLYTAAMLCGAASGALPTQPITSMVFRLRSLEPAQKFQLAVREHLESAGLNVLHEEKGTGVVLGLALTTSLSQDRLDRMLSESMARDVIEQRVRLYVRPLIPHWAFLNWIPTVAGAVLAALASLEADGVLTKGIDARNRLIPAYTPPTMSLRAGLLKIILHVLIGGELDHIDIFGTIGYQSFEIQIPAGA